MSYRDELAAAQNRSTALERELGEARRQLRDAQGTKQGANGWSRVMQRGVRAERRAQRKASHARKRAMIAKKRSEIFDARCQRFSEKRRRLRTLTAWGMAAHWMTPLALIGPLLFFLPLFFLVSVARTVVLYWIALVAGLYLISNVWGMFLAGREAKRVKALPFDVQGHDDALKGEHRDLHAALRFVGETPSSAQLKTWLLGVAAETRRPFLSATVRNTKVERKNGELVLKPNDVVTRWMRGNRSYLCWYRRVIERAASELHESFPIASVRISQ
jgi:hypothetical protein